MIFNCINKTLYIYFKETIISVFRGIQRTFIMNYQTDSNIINADRNYTGKIILIIIIIGRCISGEFIIAIDKR